MEHYNYQKIKLANGFTINYVNRPLIQKSYAALVVKYGSINIDNEINNIRYQNNYGIAHFLEHKMFDKEDGDVFQKFVANNVTELNAYTSFDRTVYYIKFAENFTKNLSLLLDFVLVPYFNDQKTAKEVGIINQEIEMYNDNLDWTIYFETLRAMYQNHPIIHNILGDKTSISKITTQELYQVHQHFYNLHNVELVFIGKESLNEVEKLVNEVVAAQPKLPDLTINNLLPIEPNQVKTKSAKLQIANTNPKIALGIKVIPKGTALANLELYWSLKLIFDCLFSTSSKIKANLIENKQISDDFSYYIDIASQYGYAIFNGSNAENQVTDIIELVNIHRTAILSNFKHYQKYELGKLMIELDKTQNIANELIDGVIGEYHPHLAITSLQAINEQVIEAKLANLASYDQTKIKIEE